jgi:regulator of sigma E protease
MPLMSILTAVAAFLLAIAVLVTVHEFGHFWVARRLGIRTLRFSIGFGKPFWSRTFGQAGGNPWELALAPIPLGGYVKMLDGREGPVPQGEEHQAFDHQPLAKRALVVVAGPAFNFLFAVLALTVVYSVGFPAVRPVLGLVTPRSVAARAGLHAGDVILAVNGHESKTWGELELALVSAIMRSHQIQVSYRIPTGVKKKTVMSIGSRKPFTVPGHLFKDLGLKPGAPRLPPVIRQVLPGSAAQKAGLLPGDRLLSINGHSLPSFNALTRYVMKHPGGQVQLVWIHNGHPVSREVLLGVRELSGNRYGFLGVTAALPAGFMKQFVLQVRDPLPVAVLHAIRYVWKMSGLTLGLVYRMITGQASIRNLSGPIRIAQYAGKTARASWISFLSFLSVLSISLGLLNLFPIPILDGGHLLYYAIEVVHRRPLSARAEWVGQQIGFGLLFLLMGLAFYNDLTHFL